MWLQPPTAAPGELTPGTCFHTALCRLSEHRTQLEAAATLFHGVTRSVTVDAPFQVRTQKIGQIQPQPLRDSVADGRNDYGPGSRLTSREAAFSSLASALDSAGPVPVRELAGAAQVVGAIPEHAICLAPQGKTGREASVS